MPNVEDEVALAIEARRQPRGLGAIYPASPGVLRQQPLIEKARRAEIGLGQVETEKAVARFVEVEWKRAGSGGKRSGHRLPYGWDS